jgi:hypothetical protein
LVGNNEVKRHALRRVDAATGTIVSLSSLALSNQLMSSSNASFVHATADGGQVYLSTGYEVYKYDVATKSTVGLVFGMFLAICGVGVPPGSGRLFFVAYPADPTVATSGSLNSISSDFNSARRAETLFPGSAEALAFRAFGEALGEAFG